MGKGIREQLQIQIIKENFSYINLLFDGIIHERCHVLLYEHSCDSIEFSTRLCSRSFVNVHSVFYLFLSQLFL